MDVIIVVDLDMGPGRTPRRPTARSVLCLSSAFGCREGGGEESARWVPLIWWLGRTTRECVFFSTLPHASLFSLSALFKQSFSAGEKSVFSLLLCHRYRWVFLRLCTFFFFQRSRSERTLRMGDCEYDESERYGRTRAPRGGGGGVYRWVKMNYSTCGDWGFG